MSDIIIYGRGKTGKSLAQLLTELGKSFVFYDDKEGFLCERSFKPDDTVILSPGVKPDALGVKKAVSAGASVMGELDYCFPLCKGRCISVTGTNGKTTVCEMTKHILERCGRGVKLLGNGGVPFALEVCSVTESDVVVLESSSFQLNGLKKFSPYVSVVTNIAQDHLDYHGSEQNYINAKINNFILQERDSFSVFNADDANTVKAASLALNSKMFYSLKDKDAQVYFDGANVIINKLAFPSGKIGGYAAHNVSNALAAISACLCVGVSAEAAIDALQDYRFLSHRLQVVKKIGGVTFIDDSKATNVHACKSAIRNYKEDTALILGGSDKGEDFDELFRDFPASVKFVAAVGDTAEKIKLSAERFDIKVEVFSGLEEAVACCFETVKVTGGIVLMSNACASFDRYGGYAERGLHFQKIVGELDGE